MQKQQEVSTFYYNFLCYNPLSSLCFASSEHSRNTIYRLKMLKSTDFRHIITLFRRKAVPLHSFSA
ncbi:hypothetical protein HMPREF1870_02084 [Bacteroidales bacterium KA00344]|nr:hypothetical protein HMPREF1870_02084 [Bacteroidales bacterium KA00344]